MKNEFNFKNIGIEKTLQLFGSLSILKFSNKSPIVFLFDENHNNENDCITKNIENAYTLIKDANVVLIGVESMAGGKEWDEEIGEYVTDNLNEKYYREIILKDWRNNCTTFSDSIGVNFSDLIIGVESVGMMNKTEVDIYNQSPLDIGSAIKNHPLSELRSKHFIKTLFEYYTSIKLKGNMILNCGSNHISHIEEWVLNGEIEKLSDIKATYVRINNL
jgi:hypothetical protein